MKERSPTDAPGANGEPRRRPSKPDLNALDAIDYDTGDVGYGRLLLWPAIIIGGLCLLVLAIRGMNFLGPY